MTIAAALAFVAAARAGETMTTRYELYLSPMLGAESGARLIPSAVTGFGSGEERLFRGLGPGPGGAAARSVRALVWDAPVAWWFGVALHESFGHGGRGREFHTSPGVHLGSPWGGRDSYARTTATQVMSSVCSALSANASTSAITACTRASALERSV